MNNFESIKFSCLTFADNPFPHFCSTSILQKSIESKLFDWFEHTGEWNLTKTEFYEQYEFSFLNVMLPKDLQCLISQKTVAIIEKEFKNVFNAKSFELVGVTAHKLTNGQRIGVHNDFIQGEETHRLVIHINPTWTDSNGGFLILFNSENSEDISKIIMPMNNSAFGFEISNRSHHAVSKIYDFSRYSIVYTFKEG